MSSSQPENKSFGEMYFGSFMEKALIPGIVAFAFLAFVPMNELDKGIPEVKFLFSVWRFLLFLLLLYVPGVMLLKVFNFEMSIKQCAKYGLFLPGFIVGLPLALVAIAVVILIYLLIVLPIALGALIYKAYEAIRFPRLRLEKARPDRKPRIEDEHEVWALSETSRIGIGGGRTVYRSFPLELAELGKKNADNKKPEGDENK